MTYAWKKSWNRGGNVAAIAAELEALRGTHGLLKPQVVLDAARDPASAMHEVFPWDDAEAAEAHRLDVARSLVRSVRVVVTGEDGDVQRRVYINVVRSKEEGRGYLPLALVAEDDELRAQVLSAALRDLRAWKTRYNELQDVLGEVFAAIDTSVGAHEARL